MSSGRGDADFIKATSELLAKRAGYRCSVPGCPIVTIGPGDADDETASVGTAAHIHSAAAKGPRGRGGLSDEQLASADNGIWCCATHGREIDTNSGRSYQVATLRAWKALREDAARKDRTGLSRGFGWVSSVTINRSPLFKSGSELQLEKCLFIEGGTSGKSSFLEWLAGAAGNNTLWRWTKRQATANYVRLTVNYNSTEQRELEFDFDRTISSYRMNGQTIYSPPTDLSIVLLREEPRRRLEGHDDLQLIAHALFTTTHQIRALLPDLERNSSGLFKGLRLEEAELEDDEKDDREEPYYELYLQQEDSAAEQPMSTLSGSELGWLLIDFACALARTKSLSTTTLLLLDAASLPFTRQTMKPLAEFIAKQKYQTLIVVVDTQIDKQNPWPNWSMVTFKKPRQMGSTTIEW